MKEIKLCFNKQMFTELLIYVWHSRVLNKADIKQFYNIKF
jgi:hypothetical protein